MHSLQFLGIIAIILIVIGLSWFTHFRPLLQMKKWNFDWYRAEFPALVGDRGVRCYKCNSSNIFTERLMQGIFMRAHICRQCGTKLYYSKE